MATSMLYLATLCVFFLVGLATAHPGSHDNCHEKCPTNKSINITCKRCTCFDGNWACTLMLCPEKECDPKKYRFDCEDCACRNGTWDCKGCPGSCGKVCPVCKTINIGCNNCTCNGGEWACTEMACPTKECDPKDYRSDCLDCKCVAGKWKCRCCGKSRTEKPE